MQFARRNPPRLAILILLCPAVAFQSTSSIDAARAGFQAPETKLPTWKLVKGATERYFAKLPSYASGDIISRRQVSKLLDELTERGWAVSDRKALEKDVLSDGDYLVQQLHSAPGRKFMRKVSRHPLIYSKLDRLSGERGGQALIRDLIRLPDGEKYARPNRPKGVPSMVDFLPRRGVSRQRTVRDYDKPTQKIYTVEQLLKRLKKSYDADRKKQPNAGV